MSKSGGYIAGLDNIVEDVLPTQFEFQALVKMKQGSLRWAVASREWHVEAGISASDADDGAATSRDHPGQDSVRQGDWPTEIDFHHSPPRCKVYFVGLCIDLIYSGIIHDDIDAPKLLRNAINRPSHIGLVGHVTDNGESPYFVPIHDAGSDSLDFALRSRQASYIGSCFCERKCDCLSYATPGTDNHHAPIFERTSEPCRLHDVPTRLAVDSEKFGRLDAKFGEIFVDVPETGLKAENPWVEFEIFVKVQHGPCQACDHGGDPIRCLRILSRTLYAENRI
jgi:hypothetical protein